MHLSGMDDRMNGRGLCMADERAVCAVADVRLRETIARLCRIRSYKAGETVVEEGRPSPIIGTVITGVLKMSKSMADGRQQVLGLLMPPDMFGRVYDKEGGVFVEAVSDTVLCTFERRAFEALLRDNPELEHRLLMSVLNELDAARNWMLLLGCQTVQERVATFLLILSRRAQGRLGSRTPTKVRVPVGRKDMAAYLGTTPETISRTIRKFAREGIINIIDPLCFEIIAPDALIAASGREDLEMGAAEDVSGTRELAAAK